jgi:hypothetical protein
MSRKMRLHHRVLRVDTLETRALLSAIDLARPGAPRVAELARAHHLQSLSGEQAILAALNGGAGSEFIKLIRHEVRNPLSVLARFGGPTPYQYTIPGMVAKTPNLQSQYTGMVHDGAAATLAGAILLKGNVIELGAIMRGPITGYPNTNYYVFALNRGAGAKLGPTYASRPGITPDALVTVAVGPYASSISASVTDLTTGSVQSISTHLTQVQGPVVRVYVNLSQLPSQGFAAKHYRFAMWTQDALAQDIANVGSFVPEDSMIPIGVMTTVKPSF